MSFGVSMIIIIYDNNNNNNVNHSNEVREFRSDDHSESRCLGRGSWGVGTETIP